MILTRYLYDKAKVEVSLRVAIKNHYYKEANFWAYELYFSGFQTTVLDILYEIYTTLFSENHPKLGRYIQMKKTTNNPELIATIIKNLTMKNPEIKETPNTKFVNVKRHHIEPFMTKQHEDLPLHTFLQQVCEYRVVGKATETEIVTFRRNWLDVSVLSPIWMERMIQYNGHIEDDKVVFDNEDDYELFYDKYDYEPDEQSLEIQMNCIGYYL